MAAITVTFYYQPDPKDHEGDLTVEQMVAEDVRAIRDEDIHLLDLEDMAYRIDYTADPQAE